ncbi:MAG: HlyD family efflux transporter periplasmic adaptor subunit [Planctomycetaceae bacterium]|nr:HlyD family efflux transporter periplasmic adaptor subunit [Planctomycetaceae bacterium]
MAANDLSPRPSNQRSIPLQMRGDLVITTSVFQHETHWVVKDPVSLEYFRLDPSQYHVLKLLDSRQTLAEISSAMERAFPKQTWSADSVRHLLIDLHQKRLVVSNRPGQGDVFLKRLRERRWKKFTRVLQNILFIRVPGWDPERLLTRLYPLTSWLFHPLTVAAGVALVLASWVLLAVGFEQFHQRLPEFQQFFSWPNVGLLWLTMGLAKLVHELAHGLACKHYGVECHEIGVAFLVFSPCLYCDVSDSWMLANKWKRILIASAGMAVEVTISAVAAFLWWNTAPGLLNHLCLNVFFVTTISTIIYNANPLLRYDGYYILSDLLEIPNLRPKADRLLWHGFAWHCMGLKLPIDPSMPKKRRMWFALFSIASALYRWFLLFAITFFLYNVLKPYGLKNLGLAMGVFSAVMLVGNFGAQILRIIRESHMKRISLPRVLTTCLLIFGLGCGAWFVPLPLRQEAPLLIEPRGIEHVYTRTAGSLDSMNVRAGQRVRRGDVLARLSDVTGQLEYEKMKSARKMQQIEVSMQRFLDNPAQQQLATGTLNAIDEQIEQYEQRLSQLVIVAPCDGIVVVPSPVPAPNRSAADDRLNGWSGMPLDAQNRGSWIRSGTHLLSVAPDDRFEAVLLVDQAHRNDIAPEQKVAIKLDQRPGKVFRGRIVKVSQRPRSIAPKALSIKFGSDVPTVTDAQGREELSRFAYEAVAILDEPGEHLLAGSRGKARFAGKRRTAGQWAWRWLNETIRFRM